MAKKKTKRESNKEPLWKDSLFIAVVITVVLFVLPVIVYIGYNKYLDWRNVEDMKQLLADFKQLESDMEAETGEQFYIKVDCDSVGGEKFSNSYTCSARVLKNGGINTEHPLLVSYAEKNDCEVLINGRNDSKNALLCVTSVRPSSIDKAEEIFIDYDTSPNSRI